MQMSLQRGVGAALINVMGSSCCWELTALLKGKTADFYTLQGFEPATFRLLSRS
jgi:hypothetical protein